MQLTGLIFLYINYCFSNYYNLGIFHQHHDVQTYTFVLVLLITILFLLF